MTSAAESASASLQLIENEAQPDAARFKGRRVSSMPVSELKKALREYGLQAQGLKSQLVARLSEFLQTHLQSRNTIAQFEQPGSFGASSRAATAAVLKVSGHPRQSISNLRRNEGAAEATPPHGKADEAGGSPNSLWASHARERDTYVSAKQNGSSPDNAWPSSSHSITSQLPSLHVAAAGLRAEVPSFKRPRQAQLQTRFLRSLRTQEAVQDSEERESRKLVKARPALRSHCRWSDMVHRRISGSARDHMRNPMQDARLQHVPGLSCSTLKRFTPLRQIREVSPPRETYATDNRDREEERRNRHIKSGTAANDMPRLGGRLGGQQVESISPLRGTPSWGVLELPEPQQVFVMQENGLPDAETFVFTEPSHQRVRDETIEDEYSPSTQSEFLFTPKGKKRPRPDSVAEISSVGDPASKVSPLQQKPRSIEAATDRASASILMPPPAPKKLSVPFPQPDAVTSDWGDLRAKFCKAGSWRCNACLTSNIDAEKTQCPSCETIKPTTEGGPEAATESVGEDKSNNVDKGFSQKSIFTSSAFAAPGGIDAGGFSFAQLNKGAKPANSNSSSHQADSRERSSWTSPVPSVPTADTGSVSDDGSTRPAEAVRDGKRDSETSQAEVVYQSTLTSAASDSRGASSTFSASQFVPPALPSSSAPIMSANGNGVSPSEGAAPAKTPPGNGLPGIVDSDRSKQPAFLFGAAPVARSEPGESDAAASTAKPFTFGSSIGFSFGSKSGAKDEGDSSTAPKVHFPPLPPFLSSTQPTTSTPPPSSAAPSTGSFTPLALAPTTAFPAPSPSSANLFAFGCDTDDKANGPGSSSIALKVASQSSVNTNGDQGGQQSLATPATSIEQESIQPKSSLPSFTFGAASSAPSNKSQQAFGLTAHTANFGTASSSPAPFSFQGPSSVERVASEGSMDMSDSPTTGTVPFAPSSSAGSVPLFGSQSVGPGLGSGVQSPGNSIFTNAVSKPPAFGTISHVPAASPFPGQASSSPAPIFGQNTARTFDQAQITNSFGTPASIGSGFGSVAAQHSTPAFNMTSGFGQSAGPGPSLSNSTPAFGGAAGAFSLGAPAQSGPPGRRIVKGRKPQAVRK